MRQHDVARSTISLRRLSNTVQAESTELISSFLGELSTLLFCGSYFFASHHPFIYVIRMSLSQNMRIHNILILVRKKACLDICSSFLCTGSNEHQSRHTILCRSASVARQLGSVFFRIVSLGELK